MSIKRMTAIWEHSQHKGSSLLLLLAIADFADDDGFAWPGVDTLSAKIRLSSRQVLRILQDVAASGELIMFSRRARGNLYIVTPGLQRRQWHRAFGRVVDFGGLAGVPEAVIAAMPDHVTPQTLSAVCQAVAPLGLIESDKLSHSTPAPGKSDNLSHSTGTTSANATPKSDAGVTNNVTPATPESDASDSLNVTPASHDPSLPVISDPSKNRQKGGAARAAPVSDTLDEVFPRDPSDKHTVLNLDTSRAARLARAAGLTATPESAQVADPSAPTTPETPTVSPWLSSWQSALSRRRWSRGVTFDEVVSFVERFADLQHADLRVPTDRSTIKDWAAGAETALGYFALSLSTDDATTPSLDSPPPNAGLRMALWALDWYFAERASGRDELQHTITRPGSILKTLLLAERALRHTQKRQNLPPWGIPEPPGCDKAAQSSGSDLDSLIAQGQAMSAQIRQHRAVAS